MINARTKKLLMLCTQRKNLFQQKQSIAEVPKQKRKCIFVPGHNPGDIIIQGIAEDWRAVRMILSWLTFQKLKTKAEPLVGFAIKSNR